MVISLFAVMFVVGVLIFLLGVKDENVVYYMLSFGLFMILVAQSIYITIPFIAATNATNYTIINKQYTEPGLGAFCLAFAITDVILIATEVVDRYRRKKNGPYIPGGIG